MKSILTLFLLAAVATRAAEPAIDAARVANSIPLTEVAVRNLGIETVESDRRTFESTVFAIGRIEENPANRSVLSSRIAGRVVEVNAFAGDTVKQGDTLVLVESRQPGNPPPTIPLTASQSGVVVDSHVRLGQPVEPENELLDISDRSQMWAVAKIPEQQAAQVAPGTKARIRIPALGSDPIEATLTRYGVTADREAGTIEGIFQIPNTDGKLLPGMRVEFSIVTGSRENVLSVPRESVQGDPANRVVYVKDFDLPNVFVRAPVEIGEQNDAYIEVLRGILPGDEVVTRGAYSLGYAGSGSGLSLKEVLDNAHGHEHNEDGSEMTPEQKAAQEAQAGNEGGSNGKWNPFLIGYAALATLAVLGLAQRRIRRS